mmetsp:Transcript_64526/g.114717  ORF Transcript_64526/g.114717 Transcript_64526/m.114717 type:complete len:168 (+) Transcript_64526:125-628(+)
MGSNCCRRELDGQGEVNLPSCASDEIDKDLLNKKVAIRRTIESDNIDLSADHVQARRGAAEPDAAQLCRKGGSERHSRTSFHEGMPQEIPRNQEEPLTSWKRSKGRKGTGFVKKEVPVDEDEDEEEEEQETEFRSCVDRRGTGFVQNIPTSLDEDEDEEEEEDSPKS